MTSSRALAISNHRLTGAMSRLPPASPAYLQLAHALEHQIKAAVFRSGDRLPSVRQLCRSFGLSIETVLHGFRVLEDRGLVEARPRSGYYAKKMIQLPEPNSRPARLEAYPVQLSLLRYQVFLFGSAKDVVPLGITAPSPDILPTDKLARIAASIARRNSREIVSYTMPEGLPALRRQLAQRARTWGCFLDPNDFIVTDGAAEALELALRSTCPPGSTVIVETPTYYGMLELIDRLGLHVVEIPARPGTGLDLDALETTLQTIPRLGACMLVTNFSNPLGTVLSEQKKQHLLTLLNRHKVPLIEDDVYGDLNRPESDRPRTAKAFDRSGNVLLCGSVSKTLAPGLRVGWICAGKYRLQVAHLKSARLCSPTLTQAVAAEFLAHGAYDAHLRRIRAFSSEQIDRFTDAVSRNFPNGTKISRPEGGYVLWIELPAHVDAIELAHRAMNSYKIAVAPGCIFSASGRRFRNCFRISCTHPWSPATAEAIKTLGALASG